MTLHRGHKQKQRRARSSQEGNQMEAIQEVSQCSGCGRTFADTEEAEATPVTMLCHRAAGSGRCTSCEGKQAQEKGGLPLSSDYHPVEL